MRSVSLVISATFIISVGGGGSFGAATASPVSEWPISASKSSKNWLFGEWQKVDSQCVNPQSWYTREVYSATEWARLQPEGAYSPGWKTYEIYKYTVNPQYAWVQLGPSASETGKVYHVDDNHIKEENQLGPTCVYTRVK